MQIHQVTTDEEYQKIDDFFSKMWMELFEIDCKNQIDKYKFCDIYFFEENSQIISAIIYNYKKWEKNYIWRFWTLAKHRGKWLWTKLIQHVLEKYEGDLFLDADEKQVSFYEHIGFQKTGESREVGNTLAYGMIYRK